ncbi:ATP-binding protein [Rossellomorea aquimaris]|uniref:AAA family ATPase n=1 Tax=Rossellomorea aquimaris TaxID=189382 RepID=UPI001CD5E807|nr:AAA family ATPase [Rossellomorea aquimaris]MCA1054150.1 ATP-binding protein [Rossellomorea aquimaris]
MSERFIFLVSGPIGVGKSTTSKKLAQKIHNCVLLEGDAILDMFDYGTEASWEKRLRLTWKHIVSLTRGFIEDDFNVVIDFVVEDELEWFYHNLSDLQITMKYIVLTAEEENVIERIRIRGDIPSIERSLFLLNKLRSNPLNQPFLIDTTFRQTAEIVELIINDPRFIVTP